MEHDTASERALLGALIRSYDVASVPAWAECDPLDFDPVGDRPESPHALLAATLKQMGDAGEPIDPTTVLVRLQTEGTLARVCGGRGGQYLLDLLESPWTVESVAAYGANVHRAAVRRRFLRAVRQAGQALENPNSDLHEVAISVAEATDAAVTSRRVQHEPSLTAEQLIAMPITYDWLVPGLFERRDRFMLVGPEGGGKSMLLRQFALCAAAGVHPFTGKYHQPRNALIVDVENSRAQISRRLEPMVRHAERIGRPLDGRLRIEVRTDQLDLTKAEDAAWLLERVVTNEADMLVIGPMYKLHAQNPNDELPARQISVALDQVRTRTGCALLMETHASHAASGQRRTFRPTGTSLWMRWPEFGRGMAPLDRPDLMALEKFRGDRDPREFPERVRYGGSGEWPWVNADEPWTPHRVLEAS